MGQPSPVPAPPLEGGRLPDRERLLPPRTYLTLIHGLSAGTSAVSCTFLALPAPGKAGAEQGAQPATCAPLGPCDLCKAPGCQPARSRASHAGLAGRPGKVWGTGHELLCTTTAGAVETSQTHPR